MSRYHKAFRTVTAILMEFDVDYYMSEACAYFALALHDLFGYRIRMLVDEDVEEDEMPLPAHVYTVDLEGNAVDIKGHRSEADVKAEFFDLEEPATYDLGPIELQREWMGDDPKPLYGPSEDEVATAKNIILSAPQRWPARRSEPARSGL